MEDDVCGCVITCAPSLLLAGRWNDLAVGAKGFRELIGDSNHQEGERNVNVLSHDGYAIFVPRIGQANVLFDGRMCMCVCV